MLRCSFHFWYCLLHVNTIVLHLEGIAVRANTRRKYDTSINRDLEANLDKSLLKKSLALSLKLLQQRSYFYLQI
jgi:hypothetical protein